MALNRELRQLGDQKAAATREIEQLQATTSEYFLSSQQGDLVYALSLQASARPDIVPLLYKGNLLDRATPVRNVIGALAMSKVLDYKSTYGQYEKLNDAAREELSFDRFMAVKVFERDVMQGATQRVAALYDIVATLQQRIEAAERKLASRQRVALALSVLGATLLLYANLVVAKSAEQPGGVGAAHGNVHAPDRVPPA